LTALWHFASKSAAASGKQKRGRPCAAPDGGLSLSFPFIIWTLQRTGGTSLTELLMEMSEHKKTDHEPFLLARAFGRVTEQWNAIEDVTALDQAMAEIFAEPYLIKHCYELHRKPLNAALARATVRANYRHILLLRKDELSRLVSMSIAEANGTWFRDWARKVYADVATGRRHFDPLPVERIVHQYKRCLAVTETIRKSLKKLRVQPFELYYEDLYRGERDARISVLNNLFDFLDFDDETREMHRQDIEEKIFHGGQGTARVLEHVPNILEVKTALAAAGYQFSDEQDQEGRDDMGFDEDGARLPIGEGGTHSVYPSPRLARQGGDDAETIHRQGYRNFVGGANVWETIAKLQFDFLLANGLKPEDKFVDVGCGALRGGRYFIEYLAPGDYYGIDKHIELIIYGTVRELKIPRFRQKRPHFAVSGSFEFERLGSGFNYGLAQSVFTHLAPADVSLCLGRLHAAAADGCKFFATFFEADAAVKNPESSHSAKGFWYTRDEMEHFGTDAGWQPSYIGDWGHPRGQRMMLYVKTANSA
jgi:hypothetical protein